PPARTAALVHSDLDATLIQQLADELGACGYDTEVITPDDLSGLPETIKRYPLIILDEWILGHTVFELLIHLKAYPECQWTPICLLCSNPTDFTIGAYYGAGVSRIIDKQQPQRPADLEAIFRRIHLSWGRFTREASSAAYFLAQEEALRLGSPVVDTEHLLLALTRLEESVALQVLERLEVGATAVREAVEADAPRGQARPGEMMQFTEAAQQALDRASEQARFLGHSYIGTEHLLLGLIGASQTVAGHVLAQLGITEEKAREVARAGGRNR
ncbi:MAG: ATP-dependent Clp protease ATP-binding subunit, partial [Fimbriimonas ginsengisoli]|nr:ATP-dependent Clp protease ATP-binding subunit [Fimbriimonas ginsengisoli]